MPIDFPSFFRALWKRDPFPWQTMLAERGMLDRWPEAISLPTASGKTACLDAAIYALAMQADRPLAERTVPRRIWFVVDRRIVVDEAHNRASRMAEKLAAAKTGTLKEVADRLRLLSGRPEARPLAVAKLRGGIRRDAAWAYDPAQPAILCSTVDQVGSSLLFRSYGHGALTASIWAGLAAHDSLILLDEAHCAVPFLQTLHALTVYRGSRWSEQPVHTPFAYTVFSATLSRRLTGDIASDQCFPRDQTERIAALDHDTLRQRMSVPKTAAFTIAPKPGKEADPRSTLPATIAREIQAYLKQRPDASRLAVMVNRVATASEVAALLSASHGASFDIVLLTGRMRPLDRDTLVARWSPILASDAQPVPASTSESAGAVPSPPTKPVIVVTTQCLEVGADFSFDVLVTECASLDALRQRFGRLDRLGRLRTAAATIVICERDTKEPKADAEDPIYGRAIFETWQWLQTLSAATGKEAPVDFGINSMDAHIGKLLAAPQGRERFAQMLAPTLDAPVLLPAHLDLLCQTSPRPEPEPDVALFLHGKQRVAAEVRVLWRADLPDLNDPIGEARVIDLLSLLPPTAPETISVPLHRIRAWVVASTASTLDEGDVEGGREPEAPRRKSVAAATAFAVWSGPDRIRVERNPNTLRPGDTLVLPAHLGLTGLAQPTHTPNGLGPNKLDLVEAATLASRPRAILRLRSDLWTAWGEFAPLGVLLQAAESPEFDRAEFLSAWRSFRDEMATLADTSPSYGPDWLAEAVKEIGATPRIERLGDASGLIVLGPARSQLADDLETADAFDARSVASDEGITLVQHSADVVRAAQRFAERCLPVSLQPALVRAAPLHDLGKLDPRFQILLRDGDEVAAISSPPLAKSPDFGPRRERRTTLEEELRLPHGFRHEMLSLQLSEHLGLVAPDDAVQELTLHVVASHHGHARPLAPCVDDSAPTDIHLGTVGLAAGWPASARAKAVPPHRLDSGIADRFWRLNRRHGWWGLAYVETIFRLADWHSSRLPGEESSELLRLSLTSAEPRESGDSYEMPLSALDGANPLGFLAALGAVVVLSETDPTIKLCWRPTTCWTPFLVSARPLDLASVVSALAKELPGKAVDSVATKKRDVSLKRFELAKKRLKDATEALKELKLRGEQREFAWHKSIDPLERKLMCRRQIYLGRLKLSVPSPELALGQRPDCTIAEFRDHAASMICSAGYASRTAVDLLAAFGAELEQEKDRRISPTPFCFITGSGHQWFLDTARKLMAEVTVSNLHKTLFVAWDYSDKGLSMRWDPAEDIRYALRFDNPGPIGAYTVWMANLLAYRALELFSYAPRTNGAPTAGWGGSEPSCFMWPIWTSPLSLNTVRSLLHHPAFGGIDLTSHRQKLVNQGVTALFRSRRIQVGNAPLHKINFSPAAAF